MFDINKKRQFNKPTVREVIQELEKLNPEADLCVIGDDQFFLHVEEDGTVASFDTEEMNDEYNETLCLEELLNSINESFDDIQENETFQNNMELVHYIGEAIGAINNCIDILSDNNKERGE